MLIRLLAVVLLIIWASDKGKALGPALVYAGITLGFGLLLHSGGVITDNVFLETGLEFALAFGLFWLVARTGGLIGWLVRAATVLLLGGVAAFLTQFFGK